jgi:hypothetical protein
MLPVKSGQTHDAWDLDFKIDGADPIVVQVFAITAQPTQLAPAFKVIIRKLSVLDVDDFGDIAKQENEGVPSGNDSDSHKVSVKDKDACI